MHLCTHRVAPSEIVWSKEQKHSRTAVSGLDVENENRQYGEQRGRKKREKREKEREKGRNSSLFWSIYRERQESDDETLRAMPTWTHTMPNNHSSMSPSCLVNIIHNQLLFFFYQYYHQKKKIAGFVGDSITLIQIRKMNRTCWIR